MSGLQHACFDSSLKTRAGGPSYGYLQKGRAACLGPIAPAPCRRQYRDRGASNEVADARLIDPDGRPFTAEISATLFN
jgi:hypothetical protein